MTIGLLIGLVSGYLRHIDAVVMRVMDGMMAIPAILLAVALMALVNASVQNVIIALTIPEVPRVVRLVRALVLSLREQPFVEASRYGRQPVAPAPTAHCAQHPGTPYRAGHVHLRLGRHF